MFITRTLFETLWSEGMLTRPVPPFLCVSVR